MCGHCEPYWHHGYNHCDSGRYYEERPSYRPSYQEDRVSRLEEYLKDLQAETRELAARLTEMKASGLKA